MEALPWRFDGDRRAQFPIFPFPFPSSSSAWRLLPSSALKFLITITVTFRSTPLWLQRRPWLQDSFPYMVRLWDRGQDKKRAITGAQICLLRWRQWGERIQGCKGGWRLFLHYDLHFTSKSSSIHSLVLHFSWRGVTSIIENCFVVDNISSPKQIRNSINPWNSACWSILFHHFPFVNPDLDFTSNLLKFWFFPIESFL